MPQALSFPKPTPITPTANALGNIVFKGNSAFEKNPTDFNQLGIIDIPSTIQPILANAIIARLASLPEGPERTAFVEALAKHGLGPDGLPIKGATQGAVEAMLKARDPNKTAFSIAELGYGPADAPEGYHYSFPAYGSFGEFPDILRMISADPQTRFSFGHLVPDVDVKEPALQAVANRINSNIVGSGNPNVFSGFNIYSALRGAGKVLDLDGFYRHYSDLVPFLTKNALTSKALDYAKGVYSKFSGGLDSAVDLLHKSNVVKDVADTFNGVYGANKAMGDLAGIFNVKGVDTASEPKINLDELGVENTALTPGSRIEVVRGTPQYRPADVEQLERTLAQQNGGMNATLGTGSVKVRVSRDPQTGQPIADSDPLTEQELKTVHPELLDATAGTDFNTGNDFINAFVREALRNSSKREAKLNK